MTEFGMVIQVMVIQAYLEGVSHVRLERRQGPASPQSFGTVPSTDAQTVWPRATKFGMVTHVSEWRVFIGQPRPYLKGAGPGVSKIYGTANTRAQSMRNKFCMVIKLEARKIFLRSTTNADVRSVCGS